ncbi:DUF3180 domain-containing protein [Leifsonia poae]|uniref:DUF3180 domain-containing protein n=1 Tax=Leifsonia poae TaxID=110933 RepID=UPI001CBC4DC4|nr:DUF3180 domain-containing protein [Leifsonia poae]
MKRSRPTPLIGLGVAGAVVGFLIELGAAGSGVAVFIPPLTLPITLVVIAVIVVAFAIPIRRATHGRAGRPIDPFQAMRVVVLAKACSLAGALLTGAGVGILIYLLSRAVLPAGNAIWLSVAATVGSAVLLIAGLVAEHMCTLPPEDDDDHPENAHAKTP